MTGQPAAGFRSAEGVESPSTPRPLTAYGSCVPTARRPAVAIQVADHGRGENIPRNVPHPHGSVRLLQVEQRELGTASGATSSSWRSWSKFRPPACASASLRWRRRTRPARKPATAPAPRARTTAVAGRCRGQDRSVSGGRPDPDPPAPCRGTGRQGQWHAPRASCRRDESHAVPVSAGVHEHLERAVASRSPRPGCRKRDRLTPERATSGANRPASTPATARTAGGEPGWTARFPGNRRRPGRPRHVSPIVGGCTPVRAGGRGQPARSRPSRYTRSVAIRRPGPPGRTAQPQGVEGVRAAADVSHEPSVPLNTSLDRVRQLDSAPDQVVGVTPSPCSIV